MQETLHDLDHDILEDFQTNLEKDFDVYLANVVKEKLTRQLMKT